MVITKWWRSLFQYAQRPIVKRKTKRASLAIEFLEDRITPAVPVLGLFNTGLDVTGHVLAAGSTDPHYTVNSGNAFVPNALPSNWTAQGANSTWIAPTADQSLGNPPGIYVYQTAFTIPVGYDLNDATCGR